MLEIKRYFCIGSRMEEHEKGEWVQVFRIPEIGRRK